MKHTRHVSRGVMTALLAAGLTAGPALAQISAVITKAGTGVQIRCQDIRWRAASKVYEYKPAGQAAAYVPIPLNQVGDLQVAPPAGLEDAMRAVQGGATSGAPIATLESVVQKYLMLEHDLQAMRWLAQAYMASGRGKEAADKFEQVMANRRAGNVPGDVLRTYWDALLEAERYSELDRQIKEAIQQGDRSAQAQAQLLRGEMDMKKGDYREALVEGFLRTIVLFQDMREIQPEALFKAANCFEELGESTYAEKMRKKLLAEFPSSSYTKRLQSGG